MLKNKKLRAALGFAVLVITLVLFIWYFKTHPEVIDQLKQVPISTLILLMILYGFFTGALMLILYVTLRLCKTVMPPAENALLTIYSSIVNFFGPLQSGPGFRAVYLKQKHKVNFKDFIKASLIYYAFFAMISGLFLFGPSLIWWQAVLGLLAIAGVCVAVVRVKKVSLEKFTSQYGLLLALFLVTFLQLSIIVIIYFVELRAIDATITLKQAIIYAGAANFALFVSLTPGAIGFRETFLLLAHRLHHIPDSTVIAASVIDRGVYVAFLGVLFVIALAMHAKSRLHVSE